MRTLSCSRPQGRQRGALICQAPCRHIPLMSWREEEELSQSPPLTFLQRSLPSKCLGMAPGPWESLSYCLLTCTQPPSAALRTAPQESVTIQAGRVCLLLKPCRGSCLTENKACEGFQGHPALQLP